MDSPRQINLYNAEFRPPRDLASFNNLAVIAGILALGMIAGAWVLSSAVTNKQAEVAHLKSQVAQARAGLAALEPQHQFRQAQVQRELSALTARGDGYRRLLDLASPKTVTFASRLDAVERSDTAGVSIVSIEMMADGPSMTIQGKLLDANELPSYIGRLQSQSALSKIQFDQLEIKPDEDGRSFSFALRGPVLAGKGTR